MEPKLPLQPKTLRRRVHVVYYLSRGGQMDHPHLLEGYLSSAQEGLLLRDFKRWLAILRGKSMPNSFSWSYKRAYKNGFVWHDLGENDLIRPLAKNEYVLMGSEIKEQPLHVEKCNCGVNPQQTDTKMDSTKTGSDNQGETVNKPVTRSPKLITERSSNDREDNKTEKVLPSLDSPARLELITTENKFQRIGSRTLHKSFDLYRSGGPSKDPNDFTDKRLPDELKNSSNIHDTKQFTTTQSSENMGHIPSPGKISVRDSKITLRNSQREYLEDGDQMGELHGRDRKKNIKHIRDTSSSTHLKHTISIAHAKADRVKDSIKEKKYGQKLSDSCINDESTSSFIVDASTQTGDSTRCSMEEQQECIDSECYDRPVGDLANSSYHSSDFSPYDSTILNSVRRISSARFNSNHDQDQSHRGNLSLHLSQEFPNLPAIQRSIKAEQSSEIEEIPIGNSNTSLSHQISQNHLGSPGTVSSCSAVSARSSTRFARQETNGIPITVMPTKPTKKTTARTENHRRHSKGGSSQHSTNAAMESSSSGPHSLLKQILTCGNADVVSEKKPHNSISSHNFVVINHNALSGLPGTTPSRAINAATRTYDDLDKSRNAICGVCQRGVPIKKVTRTASSDTKAVISATASEQGSTRDDTISSPESAFSSGYRHHIKSNMMKAHSLSSSFAAAALRSASSRSHRSNLTAADENDDDGSKLSASRRFRVHHPASATAANSGTPYGNMSPGLLSIASSTPRRSSIRENEVKVGTASDAEEGFQEPCTRQHIGHGISSNYKMHKGTKASSSRVEVLDKKCLPREASEHKIDSIDKRGPKSYSVDACTVNELHKLICNPGGLPTPKSYNRTSSKSLLVHPPQTSTFEHVQTNTYPKEKDKDSHAPRDHPKIYHILEAHQGSPHNTVKNKTSTSRNDQSLSKSLNSPSSLFLEESIKHENIASSHLSSWRDLLWSPRSSSLEKEKRKSKP